MKTPVPHRLLPAILALAAAIMPGPATAEASPPRLKAYHTRLPFDDHGFTGKYADIIVELPRRGRFIFSREFGYQPYWMPVGGKPHLVARLIPRTGDGPDERPDNHNIACNAAIVAQSEAAVTVRWRYAPDITKLSFTDFAAAYNAAGNPAPFYADYAEESFTIHADGKVERVVKNGCQRLEDWNDPRNQIGQTMQLTPDGIRETSVQPAQLSKAPEAPVSGPQVKSGHATNLVRHWRFDEGIGRVATEHLVLTGDADMSSVTHAVEALTAPVFVTSGMGEMSLLEVKDNKLLVSHLHHFPQARRFVVAFLSCFGQVPRHGCFTVSFHHRTGGGPSGQ